MDIVDFLSPKRLRINRLRMRTALPESMLPVLSGRPPQRTGETRRHMRDAVLCELLSRVLDHGGSRVSEWGFINTKVKDTLEKFFYDRTKRRPMILPFMVKV